MGQTYSYIFHKTLFYNNFFLTPCVYGFRSTGPGVTQSMILSRLNWCGSGCKLGELWHKRSKTSEIFKSIFFRKLKCLIQCTQNVPYAKRKIVSTCFKARFLESRDVHTTAVHCDKLNSRMPSIASLIEWINLQSFFKRNIWDKRIKIDKNRCQEGG